MEIKWNSSLILLVRPYPFPREKNVFVIQCFCIFRQRLKMRKKIKSKRRSKRNRSMIKMKKKKDLDDEIQFFFRFASNLINVSNDQWWWRVRLDIFVKILQNYLILFAFVTNEYDLRHEGHLICEGEKPKYFSSSSSSLSLPHLFVDYTSFVNHW